MISHSSFSVWDSACIHKRPFDVHYVLFASNVANTASFYSGAPISRGYSVVTFAKCKCANAPLSH